MTIDTPQPFPSRPIPTYFFTGFLGAGKTTAILHLLANKPHGEKWAILVNEFGEVGIDGSLFQSTHDKSIADKDTDHKGTDHKDTGHKDNQDKGIDNTVTIREVPGGCMCCAAGLPVQIALNQLIHRAQPDRLFIEPTGLGHPVQIIKILSADHYRDLLDLQKIVTLVDARRLHDDRYRQHKTFQQQVSVADLIVGNKHDLYGSNDAELLHNFVEHHGKKTADVVFVQHGQLSLDQLNHKTDTQADKKQPPSLSDLPIFYPTTKTLLSDQVLPKNGYLSAKNQGEGFCSIGWRFSKRFIFNKEALVNFLRELTVERVKGVFHTNQGNYSYNINEDTFQEQPLGFLDESRLEIISQEIDDAWEKTIVQLAENQ